MKRTKVIVALASIAVIAVMTAPAHARLYMMMHGSNVYPAVTTPMPTGPVAPMVPMAVAPMPGRRPMPTPSGFVRPHVGVNIYPAVSSPRPHPDGTNLYQYVRSNPVNLVDPAGLAAVDPTKDCGLRTHSNWSMMEGVYKPGHYWIHGNNGDWDFGPDFTDIQNRYQNKDYFSCGALRPCNGVAPFHRVGPGGNVKKATKLKWWGWAKMKAGSASGKSCKCVSCGDIADCLGAVEKTWNNTSYDHWFRNCGHFAADARSKCCLYE